MSQQIFNTLTRTKEAFTPASPDELKLYVCGPTVYDLSHIGHARVYTVFDAIVRFLRRSTKVIYVRNYTDVDDKIIKRGLEKKTPPEKISAQFINEFKADMAAIGNRDADIEPLVTTHIPEIIAVVQKLVDRDAAYLSQGDVYYAVEKFEGYGKLSRRTLEDMEAGYRVEVSEQKRHPMDFALWKAAKPGEPFWESPFGPGRPGWHIECSAMSHKHLGMQFDIHGGGRDLIFPHHENEIAQSEAAFGGTMARVWMHGGMVNIDNEKMSKSLGNFFTIRQVLEKFDAQTLRFYLLATHYRSPINFSDAALTDAEGRIKYFYETLLRIDTRLGMKDAPAPTELGQKRRAYTDEVETLFVRAMEDDFNTPEAIGALSEPFRVANDILSRPGDADADAKLLSTIGQSVRKVGLLLGLFEEKPGDVLGRLAERKKMTRKLDTQVVEGLVKARDAARAAKDFATADRLRKQLDEMGIAIKDGSGPTHWEPK